jgi:hypothetical protein
MEKIVAAQLSLMVNLIEDLAISVSDIGYIT